MYIIQDGTGSGKKCNVTNDNELKTFSSYRDEALSNALKGTGYVASTSFIDLTNTSDYNGILYIKNTLDKDIYVGALIFTSTVGANRWKVIRNATAGTMISNAVAADQNPALLGLNRTLNANIYKGGDNYTVTDGQEYAAFIAGTNHGGTMARFSVISPGSSICWVVKPAAACTVAANVFLFTVE